MVVMPVVDILANEIGNVSEEELDRDTKQFEKIRTTLKAKMLNDVLCAFDYDYTDSTGFEFVKDLKFAKVYKNEDKDITVVVEKLNGYSYCYFLAEYEKEIRESTLINYM